MTIYINLDGQASEYHLGNISSISLPWQQQHILINLQFETSQHSKDALKGLVSLNPIEKVHYLNGFISAEECSIIVSRARLVPTAPGGLVFWRQEIEATNKYNQCLERNKSCFLQSKICGGPDDAWTS